MQEEKFWELVDTAKTREGSVSKNLKGLLVGCSPEDVVAFDTILHEKTADLYTWDLWGVAYLLLGGCSDDSFDYFRGFVVSLGKADYDLARTDPETFGMTLAAEGLDEEDMEDEDFLYAPAYAYEILTGDDDIPSSRPPYHDPKGQPWEEDELGERFPRLTQALQD